MDKLTERNMLAMSQGLKDQQGEISKLNLKSDNANNSIASLQFELNALRGLVMSAITKTLGSTQK
mgnify:CR=1 FL=1